MRGAALSRHQALLLHSCPSYSGAGHRVLSEQLHQLPDLSLQKVRAPLCPHCSMRSTVACAAPALPPPCLASSQGLLHVCKAPWWADAVFCCAGARFRTAGLEDAGQPALGSSPEPQQLSEDKPQVLAQPFPPTLPTFGSGMCRCWGGWHLPLCCPSLAVESLTPGKATQDGSCRSSRGQGSQWLLWNPAGYSWMLGWHLYRPIEKS